MTVRKRIVKGSWMVVERLLRFAISPRLRATILRLMGASIGSNVRIYEAQFMNLSRGFRNLSVGQDAHIGHGCLIDLEGQVHIARGAVLSPRVILLSHSDPGSSHGSPLARKYGVKVAPIRIGEHAWLGAGTIVLTGVSIGSEATTAAGAVVKDDIPNGETWGGVPARRLELG